MFILGAGIVVINVLKTYLCTLLGAQIAKDVRKKMFDKLQALSVQFINDRRPGELMDRVVYDTGNIRDFMQHTFCNLFTVAFIFGLDVIFMLAMNWKLAHRVLVHRCAVGPDHEEGCICLHGETLHALLHIEADRYADDTLHA